MDVHMQKPVLAQHSVAQHLSICGGSVNRYCSSIELAGNRDSTDRAFFSTLLELWQWLSCSMQSC
jgi:hypothetical protein